MIDAGAEWSFSLVRFFFFKKKTKLLHNSSVIPVVYPEIHLIPL
jgi:hypothetical protein